MAGTAIEIPRKGDYTISPVKNRNVSDLFAAGGLGGSPNKTRGGGIEFQCDSYSKE